MATRLARKVRALGCALLLLAFPVALAQPAQHRDAGSAAPSVESATFHQLVFANEDFAVLNNLYPPGGDSGFHAHHRDLFAVIIQPARSSIQNLGQEPVAGPTLPAGGVSYGVISEPRVHRVVNLSDGIYQIIVVEIRRPTPSGAAISSRVDAPQYEQIVDNQRMRAWRLVLAPGQSAPSISQGGSGVRIVVRGGLLTTTTPGLPDQILALQAGDFAVQSSGFARALRNTGTETIELVELELK